MKSSTVNLALTAGFLGLGIILPMFIGQIPQIGRALLPMHIPVYLCAFICGWRYAVPMAAILPMLRTVVFGRPELYPDAVAIACEMATYALIAGLIYSRFGRSGLGSIYISLGTAMAVGRVVRATVEWVLLCAIGLHIPLLTVLYGVLVAGLTGILLQFAVIPTVVMIARHHTKP